MANKRNLKKQISYICGDVATECLIAAEYVKGINVDEMRNIVCKLAVLQENALKSVTFAFDKTPAEFASRADYNKARSAYFKTAYKALRDKFNTRILEIVKEMNAALPQEVKDANKRK